jgi:hypothetical protein
MNTDELRANLKTEGWTFFPNDGLRESGVDWRAALKTEGIPQCLCNDRSPQVVVTPWRYAILGKVIESLDVTICGETPNGWVKLKVYGLTYDMEAIGKACVSMKSAWTSAFNCGSML